MSKELAKTYDPSGIEDRLYQKWLDKKYFHAEVDHSKTPFTIVIPPPNITGQLHMGHALDNTMQDILIRYKRMQGYNALWQPGTDHASIATEVKIIQKLKEEGIDKHDLGREKFLERAWEWKKEYGGRIISQLKKLGSSCDWDRERFTMDEGCNKAVTEVFVKMHEKGYIYKGARMFSQIRMAVLPLGRRSKPWCAIWRGLLTLYSQTTLPSHAYSRSRPYQPPKFTGLPAIFSARSRFPLGSSSA